MMQIDFNHLRKKTGDCYNELAQFLQQKNNDGVINFEDSEIEEIMFDLRSSIGAIMCTYDDNDDGFKSLHNDPYLTIFSTYEDSLLDESSYHAE